MKEEMSAGKMLTHEQPKIVSRGLATGALVLGILALCTTCFFINYIFGIISLILAIVYLVKKGIKNAKGRAITGLVCTVLSMVISTYIYGSLYIYVTETSLLDIMEDLNEITGGVIDPEEMVEELIQSYIPDTTAIERILGKELNYATLCEFVGEEVSVSTIQNFIGDGIDADDVEELIEEVDANAVREDLGGEFTYEALEDKIGNDFTYEELEEYLKEFKRTN